MIVRLGSPWMGNAAWLPAVLSIVAIGCSGAAQQQPDCECSHASLLGEVTPAAASAELVAGPMLGYATQREVAIWLETAGPAQVAVRYWPVGAPESALESGPTATEATADDTHIVRVSELMAGERYAYEVLVDGEVAERDYPLEFVTQTNWRWRTDPWEPPDFRFAFGSCFYVNDEPYDRAGSPYGGGYHIFESIRQADPDFMLWLGDSTYYRESDWSSPAMMAHRFGHDRALPELQPLLAATNNYAIWDDHDFGPNDSDRSFEFQGEALDVFRNYWANPSYGLPDEPGVFTRFVWGDVEFFLLDDRYHRAPNDAPDGPDKDYLGDEQLEWLIDALTSSNATFKIIANGNQVLNDNTPYEAYSQFDEERQRLLAAIAERRIDGVLFISGDRHHSELLSNAREGTYALYDFTSSPLTSGAADARHELENPQRVEGTLVVSTRSFATIDVAGPDGDRTLTLSAWDDAGGLLWDFSLNQEQLTTPE